MRRAVNMEVIRVSLLACSFLYAAAASSQCALGKFKCTNGRCIDVMFVCDNYNHCGDHSDETICDSSHCPPFTFKCLNGKCVTRRRLCLGGDDCGDKSDEMSCERSLCHSAIFQCLDGECKYRTSFCDNGYQCLDRSDELYCDIDSSVQCPPGWTRCPSGNRCILSSWVCDGWDDCNYNHATPGISEEANCETNMTVPSSTNVKSPIITTTRAFFNITKAKTISTKVATSSGNTVLSPESTVAKAELESWFLRMKTLSSGTYRWGSQVPRIAVALHLADNSTFSPGNSTGDEIRYELMTQLLYRLGKNKKMSAQTLALYVHALLVSCLDPRDFYGDDLVRKLRERVEASGNSANPFVILALCNAGNAMTDKDVERVTNAYDSQKTPFWTDYQALASMALSCISESGVSVKSRTLSGMLQELKKRQLKNGTVDNFRTTALVTQALFIHDSYKLEFDLDSAMKVLTGGLISKSSLLDVYYALPALSKKSLLNATSGHCNKQQVADSLPKTTDVTGETITVKFSIWMGDEKSFGQTWCLRVRVDSSVYDAIEAASNINRLKVEYNVVDGKPYVSALKGKEEDPELGLAWFVYLKTLSLDKDIKLLEESPVDIKLLPNQEIILWYKKGPLIDYSQIQNSLTMP